MNTMARLNTTTKMVEVKTPRELLVESLARAASASRHTGHVADTVTLYRICYSIALNFGWDMDEFLSEVLAEKDALCNKR